MPRTGLLDHVFVRVVARSTLARALTRYQGIKNGQSRPYHPPPIAAETGPFGLTMVALPSLVAYHLAAVVTGGRRLTTAAG